MVRLPLPWPCYPPPRLSLTRFRSRPPLADTLNDHPVTYDDIHILIANAGG